jgi:hypothetical protein
MPDGLVKPPGTKKDVSFSKKKQMKNCNRPSLGNEITASEKIMQPGRNNNDIQLTINSTYYLTLYCLLNHEVHEEHEELKYG